MYVYVYVQVCRRPTKGPVYTLRILYTYTNDTFIHQLVYTYTCVSKYTNIVKCSITYIYIYMYIHMQHLRSTLPVYCPPTFLSNFAYTIYYHPKYFHFVEVQVRGCLHQWIVEQSPSPTHHRVKLMDVTKSVHHSLRVLHLLQERRPTPQRDRPTIIALSL